MLFLIKLNNSQLPIFFKVQIDDAKVKVLQSFFLKQAFAHRVRLLMPFLVSMMSLVKEEQSFSH